MFEKCVQPLVCYRLPQNLICIRKYGVIRHRSIQNYIISKRSFVPNLLYTDELDRTKKLILSFPFDMYSTYSQHLFMYSTYSQHFPKHGDIYLCISFSSIKYTFRNDNDIFWKSGS